MAAFQVWFMQPRNARADLQISKSLCERVNETGFNIHPPNDHLVFVNTFAQSTGHALCEATAYEFDPVGFGLYTKNHPTQLLCPVGKYSFDEIQDLIDSHSGNLAPFVSKTIELSRQLELFLMFALQRPKRLPLDVRELATFIECVGRKNIYNKRNRLIATEWTINIIYNNANLESYLSSHDKKYIDKTIKYRFNGNIYNCYDPNYYMLMFYAGHDKNEILQLQKSSRPQFTENGLKEYYEKHKIDIPESYRGKKKEAKNGQRTNTS